MTQERKQIAVLGGGISGLSAAWYFAKEGHAVTLIEKSDRLGGWMGTERIDGFLFERGPRTFPLGRARALLDLVKELGLEDQLIESASGKRYLCVGGKLRSLFSPMLLLALRDLWQPKGPEGDESIGAFVRRRFGNRIAERYIDPMVKGIYAGNMDELSLLSTFPFLKDLEQRYGSVLKGMLKKKKGQKGLLSFRGGTQQLIDALEAQLPAEICKGEEVLKVEGTTVTTDRRTHEFDHVVSTLPRPDIKYKSLSICRLAWKEDVLPIDGFGYLVPSSEKEKVLGVLFDSKIFPQQGSGTRLTVMMDEENGEQEALSNPLCQRSDKILGAKSVLENEANCKSVGEFEKPICHPKDDRDLGNGVDQCLLNALDAIRRHVGVDKEPDVISHIVAKHAIPQPEVGQKMGGVSVNACIERGRRIAQEFAQV